MPNTRTSAPPKQPVQIAHRCKVQGQKCIAQICASAAGPPAHLARAVRCCLPAAPGWSCQNRPGLPDLTQHVLSVHAWRPAAHYGPHVEPARGACSTRADLGQCVMSPSPNSRHQAACTARAGKQQQLLQRKLQCCTDC